MEWHIDRLLEIGINHEEHEVLSVLFELFEIFNEDYIACRDAASAGDLIAFPM
jgi:hypothetical protein